MKKRILSLTVICFFSQCLIAQIDNKTKIDTATNMIWIDANFGYLFPFGDLATIFKGNFTAGPSVTYKTESNWTFSANFNYMFGANMRSYDIDFMKNLIGDIINSHGDLIDGWGRATTVYFEGRYWAIKFSAGKVVPVSRWKNSGLYFNAGFGFLQHKLYIDIPDPSTNSIPQFQGNYKKIYDRRSSGFYMSQFLGYLFIQKIRVASFYAGIELGEMWTKPDRNYIYNVGLTKDIPPKFSFMLGLKIAWIVPLYEHKKAVNYYTY